VNLTTDVLMCAAEENTWKTENISPVNEF